MKQLSQLRVPQHHSLASLDVVSLFTNVPAAEAIDIAVGELYNGDFNKPSLSAIQFKELLLLTTSILLDTPVGIYRQVDGVAMGSRLGPMLSNLFLWKKVDNQLRIECSYYQRYVDDTLIIAETNRIESIHRKANSLSSLAFTLENGGNQINFLNLNINQSDSQLAISNYVKSTDTGLSLNFLSAAPTTYKASIVSGDVRRAYDTSSSWEKFNNTIGHLKKKWKNNQFPSAFADTLLRRTLDRIIEGGPRPEKTDEVVIKIPFQGKKTEHFKKRISDIFKEKARPVITTTKLKQVLPTPKSKIPACLTAHVVYQISCSSCHRSYVGKTDRYLDIRVKEHNRPPSSVALHRNHCGGDTQVKVLSKESNQFKLSIKEAVHIKRLKPQLNSRSELGFLLSLRLL